MTREPAIGAALVERVEFAEVGAAELIEREWRGSCAAVENQAVQAIARRMTQDAGRSAYLGPLHNLRQAIRRDGSDAMLPTVPAAVAAFDAFGFVSLNRYALAQSVV
jgi:hypothetical protein